MIFELRKYQSEAIEAIFNFFYSGRKGNPLVVAPTGSGKTIILSGFCQQVLDNWPDQKILIISHIKEILEQDYKALKKHLNTTDIGLYSFGLKSKELKNITVAGIQSIYNKPELFDLYDIIVVDEAHLIPHSKNGMYHKFFKEVTKPVIGLTATPFRLGYGYLHLGKDAFFHEIVYNIKISELQKLGYLCTLTTKGTEERLDASDIKKQAGDYILKELSLAFDKKGITKKIINELLKYKNLRKKWLLFAIDIEHAEHINYELNKQGIKSGVVHSKIKGDRKIIIDKFKDDDYQALVSVAVLTTGFDAPDVDLIVLLRPTASPVLHVQIIGRGLRVSDKKENCLILDFAGNIMRNGPIDSPVIKLKGKGGGEAIMKECPQCWEIVHAATRICPACDYKFQFKHKLSSKSANVSILVQENWHQITDTNYACYVGSNNIPMLLVTYMCGFRAFKEYICIQHGGYVSYKALHWWKKRCKTEFLPATSQQALENANQLMIPTEIMVNESSKFPSITQYKFKETK